MNEKMIMLFYFEAMKWDGAFDFESPYSLFVLKKKKKIRKSFDAYDKYIKT